MNNTFQKITNLWLELTPFYYEKPEVIIEHINKNYSEVNKYFDFLKPISEKIIKIVINEYSISKDIDYGLGINRFLGNERKIELLNPETKLHLNELISNHHYLGLLAHNFFTTMDTRSNYPNIDIQRVEESFFLESLIADVLLKGLDKDSEGKTFYEFENLHFEKYCKPFLNKKLEIGFWKMGKIRSFFRNLLLAGILLGMKSDLATKGNYDSK